MDYERTLKIVISSSMANVQRAVFIRSGMIYGWQSGRHSRSEASGSEDRGFTQRLVNHVEKDPDFI